MIKIASKKAQITGIVAFVGILLAIIFLGPILLKVIVAPAEKFTVAMEGIDATNKSAVAVNYLQTKATSMFDWIFMFFFIFNVMILLITSFMVDIHPAFLIVYIIAVFFIVLLAPSILDSVNTIWQSAQFSVGTDDVVKYLPMLDFLRSHFTFVVLGIIILSGLIMYGKYRLGSSGANPSSGGDYH